MRTIGIHTRKRAIFVAGNSDSIEYIYAFSAPSLVSGLLIFLIQPISGRKKSFQSWIKIHPKVEAFSREILPDRLCL